MEEKIEEAKLRLKILLKDSCDCPECIRNKNAYKILLQHIEELEESNKELDRENNRLEKIEFERNMANKMIDEMAVKLNELSDRLILAEDTDCFIPREYSNIDDCLRKISCADCVRKTSCVDCIKQYFKEKVEEK